MYLYASEHALMDYHLNEEKNKVVTAEVKPKEETKPEDGLDTDRT